ncbi:MAG: abscisic acid-deficient protein Aba4 family protein [Aggregatilineales bacterium]
MLQLIAELTLLIVPVVWLVLIFRPDDERTRHLIEGYYVFVPLGVLSAFLLIGLVAAWSATGSAIGAAFDAANAPNAGANATQALSDGLKTAQSAMPTLILSFFALLDVADLAGGHIIYADMRKRGESKITTGIFLALVYLLGPVGMFAFVAWRHLSMLHKAQINANPTPPAVESSQPAS